MDNTHIQYICRIVQTSKHVKKLPVYVACSGTIQTIIYYTQNMYFHGHHSTIRFKFNIQHKLHTLREHIVDFY